MKLTSPKKCDESSTISALKRFCRTLIPRSSKKKLLKNRSSISQSSLDDSHSEGAEREYGEIERVFRYIDENGDGKISPAELQRCVMAVGSRRLTAEEAELAVESSDSDGDGLLSLEDFERLMGGDGLSVEEKREELRDAFLMYKDKKKDGSGCITPQSLKTMLSRLGESKSTRDCMAMIRVYDRDGDGVLSFDDFVAMMV